MNKQILGSLAGAILLATSLPVFADQVTTTTETIHDPPVVLDSYMKPTVMQTKTVTTEDGVVRTESAPMVLERHEKVVCPTSEIKTTTTTSEPRVVTEEVTKTVVKTASNHKKVAHRIAYRPKPKPRHRHIVAYRHAANRQIAENIHVKKTTIVEPQVTQETQTVRKEDLYIDRRDPALDDF